MNQAVVSLGSNIDPEQHIAQAKKLLADKFELLAVSNFVWTKPIGIVNQPDFLNGAVLIRTEYDSAGLKQALRAIEGQLGRKRGEPRYGPRTIDLDIVVFNGKIIDPDFYERDFIQKAVLELVSDLKYEQKTE